MKSIYPHAHRLIVLLTALALAGCAAWQKPPAPAAADVASECVILLHGLMRTSRSLAEVERALTETGYQVVNDGYPSRRAEIGVLAAEAIPPAIEQCRAGAATRISFVTHSLGGILVRAYLADNTVPELGRVVMLGPPNNGSELVDSLIHLPGLKNIYGPTFEQLGTGNGSVPRELGAADFDVGIIIGQTPGLLSILLPGPDDGTVTVESAKLEGMSDFLVADAGHTFVMNNNEVIRQMLYFLQHGQFDRIKVPDLFSAPDAPGTLALRLR